MTTGAGRKAWEGRLGTATARSVETFSASVADDVRLWREDVEGSRAHAAMLRAVGILDEAEHTAIAGGLDAVADELAGGRFAWADGDEDVHMAVERRLVELVGVPGEKLHTGRSRNDQVATDLRLWCRRATADLLDGVAALTAALLGRAAEHRETLLPGYTHLQRAQVVSLAHHLLAYAAMLDRDAGRLADAARRADVLPLGSGALAGTTLPLDRDLVARHLGFAAVSANSLDAVSDRDFVVELVSACSLLMTHLSRLAEEIVLWTTAEFGFARLPDSHATGSSLMPQKKNPDVLELIRGRSGRVTGALVALLTTLKGLPLAYNRDLQEDKRSLFDSVDTTAACLAMAAEVVAVLEVDAVAMAAAAADPALIATDVADHLVGRGVAFREAHRVVGRGVRLAEERGLTLADLDAADWSRLHPAADAGILGLFDARASLERRVVAGSPSPSLVEAELARAGARLAAMREAAAALRGGSLGAAAPGG